MAISLICLALNQWIRKLLVLCIALQANNVLGNPTPAPTSIPYATLQNSALCGFIAATNIEALYNDWSCTVSSSVSSNPCTAPWFGVTCSGSIIIAIDLGNQPVVGTVPVTFGSLSTLTFLGLYSTSLAGKDDLCFVRSVLYHALVRNYSFYISKHI